MVTTVDQKHRVNIQLTEDAHRVLVQNSTPRTIGKFISELLVQYANNTTLRHRLEILEERVLHRMDILEQRVGKMEDTAWIAEVKAAAIEVRANPEETTIPWNEAMQELGVNV